MAALALPGSGLGSSQPGSAACAKPSCLGGTRGVLAQWGKGWWERQAGLLLCCWRLSLPGRCSGCCCCGQEHDGPSEGGWGGLGLPGSLIPLPQHLIDHSDPSDGGDGGCGGGAGSRAGLSGKVLALLDLFPTRCSPRRESDPAPKRDSHDQGWELPLLCSASDSAPVPGMVLQEDLHWAETPQAADAGRELRAGKRRGAGGRERSRSC